MGASRVDADDSALECAAGLLGARVRRDEPIGPRTTYRVGGAAALFCVANDVDDLMAIVAAVRESGVGLVVLGNGSNLLVTDAGFAGLIVALGGGFGEMTIDPGEASVRAGGAVALPVLARKSAAAGLSGMEWAVGIPGSVGGAVAMNAGGHGASTGDRLISARVLDFRDGAERVVGPDGLGLGYRTSNVAASEIVVEAQFACAVGERAGAEAEIDAIVRWRRTNQPGGRNAGSVFRNPPDDSAGRLIDACGLKGHRVGSAEVSTKHANFFQCDIGGSADDVIALIEDVRERVFAATGIALVTELKIVGERR